LRTLNYPRLFFAIVVNKKNIAIWIGILGGGIGFFLFYGYVAELMR